MSCCEETASHPSTTDNYKALKLEIPYFLYRLSIACHGEAGANTGRLQVQGRVHKAWTGPHFIATVHTLVQTEGQFRVAS